MAIQGHFLKSKLKLFFWGFLFPFLLAWGLYSSFVLKHSEGIFDLGLRSFYHHTFLVEDLASGYPAIDLIVLGDSPSQSVISPLAIEFLFTVNLSVPSETALSAYTSLERYLSQHPAPKCILYLADYNSQKDYLNQIKKLIIYKKLDWRGFQKVWETGIAHQIFPATEYSYFGFVLDWLQSSTFLDDLRLSKIQSEATRGESSALRELRWKRSLLVNRGYLDVGDGKRIAPESYFFDEKKYGHFNQNFEPYSTEDFYLELLAKLAHDRGSRFIYSYLPVAESPYATEENSYFHQRDEHMDRLLSGLPGIHKISLPNRLPRSLFSDFVHLTKEGSTRVQSLLEPQLKKFCQAQSL